MHDLFYPQVGNFTLALLGSFNLALTPRARGRGVPEAGDLRCDVLQLEEEVRGTGRV